MVAGATAVAIGAVFTVVGLSEQDFKVRATNESRAAPVAPPSTPDYPPTAVAAPTPPSASPARTRPSTARPSTARPTTARPTTARLTTARPTTPAPRRSTPASRLATDDRIARAVLDHINESRADAGLAEFRLDADLSRASAKHTALMIGGCGMRHQCPGEDGIGDRFSAEGVHWTRAGENIGYATSGSGDAAIIRAATGITDRMLAEKAPDDGHRRNLLSSAFTRIGLSIVRDGRGQTWITQDFVN